MSSLLLFWLPMNTTLATTLEEWLMTSFDKDTHRQYEEALTSIRRYPFDINTPQDLLKLNGFNRQLAKRLFDETEHLGLSQESQSQKSTHHKRRAEPETEKDEPCSYLKKTTKRKHTNDDPDRDSSSEKDDDDDDDYDKYDCSINAEIRREALEEGKGKKRKRNYVPKKGSSSYALVMGLFDAKAWKEESAVEKTVLIEKAKVHSDVALEPPDCQKPATVFRPKQFYFYSGWGSIKTLMGNGIVLTGKRKGTRKTLYYLSVDGVMLAQKLAHMA